MTISDVILDADYDEKKIFEKTKILGGEARFSE